MSPEEWTRIVGSVTDRMLDHVRPFGTPLGTATAAMVRLVGSGTYVRHESRTLLLTCEHVARNQPIHFRFWGSDNIFEHKGTWVADRHPVDAAFAEIGATTWNECASQADAIPFERFATGHNPARRELLFFRGFAGENARYAFGVHQTNASGYCTQEKKDTGDEQIFELFWEPQQTHFTPETSGDVKAETKFDNPEGFSGSLVWNTRYLEVTNAGDAWKPQDAVVTGLLRRWNQKTKTLLAWRVECLRGWLEKKGAGTC